MKHALLIFVTLTVLAQEIRPRWFVLAKGNELVIRVRSVKGSEPIEPGERLTFDFNTLTERTNLLFLPKDGHFFWAQLRDSKSNALPLTRLGKQLTRNFVAVTNYAPELLKARQPEKVRQGRFEMITVRPEGQGSQIEYFHTVEELFQIPAPGNYYLQLQFKVFTKQRDSTNAPSLVTFPALEIPIVKYE